MAGAFESSLEAAGALRVVAPNLGSIPNPPGVGGGPGAVWLT